jgi:hypothetical protein
MRKRTNLFGVSLALPALPVVGVLISTVMAVSNCTMERLNAQDALANNASRAVVQQTQQAQPTEQQVIQMDYVLASVPPGMEGATRELYQMNGKYYKMIGIVVQEVQK